MVRFELKIELGEKLIFHEIQSYTEKQVVEYATKLWNKEEGCLFYNQCKTDVLLNIPNLDWDGRDCVEGEIKPEPDSGVLLLFPHQIVRIELEEQLWLNSRVYSSLNDFAYTKFGSKDIEPQKVEQFLNKDEAPNIMFWSCKILE